MRTTDRPRDFNAPAKSFGFSFNFHHSSKLLIVFLLNCKRSALIPRHPSTSQSTMTTFDAPSPSTPETTHLLTSTSMFERRCNLYLNIWHPTINRTLAKPWIQSQLTPHRGSLSIANAQSRHSSTSQSTMTTLDAPFASTPETTHTPGQYFYTHALSKGGVICIYGIQQSTEGSGSFEFSSSEPLIVVLYQSPTLIPRHGYP
ncbi:hypothetical protein Hypma_009830 [Hypsizygus marmoreus]|uniref:Uncharacterized protein n=1 Tax=Hypsizygus marmoreus TaxID=39966 RepID=A0A369JP88_HYPMA|nr:hypothetical protein Hypma_009830 [Hypsizygus marmoreus]